MRSTFPAGRAAGRLTLDVLPFGLVCWAPDRSDRILFTGGDHRLYLTDFPEGAGTGREPASPRPLRWRTEPPGVGEFRFRNPCWPGKPALGGRLLVALNYREADRGRIGACTSGGCN